jgi:hypothetical protein
VKRLVVDVRGGDYSVLRLPPGTAPEPELFGVGGVTVVSVISGPDGVTVVCPTRVAPASDAREDGWRLLSAARWSSRSPGSWRRCPASWPRRA